MQRSCCYEYLLLLQADLYQEAQRQKGRHGLLFLTPELLSSSIGIR
jgi:hypothetical protein